jgi:hypothetical protein
LLNSITANIQVTEGGTVNSPRLNEDMIWYDIFNCNWITTRWQ